MKKLAPLVVVAALAVAAPSARAQTIIEAGGELGYTSVNVNNWLGAGVFDPQRIGYGWNAAILFGRRGARGFHYGAEVGWARLMNYRFIFQGSRFDSGINALRVQGVVRFWFDDGAYFGEGAAGMIAMDGSSGSGTVLNPVLSGGLGTLWGLSDRVSLLTKANGQLVFDSGSMIFTIRGTAGLSYTPGG